MLNPNVAPGAHFGFASWGAGFGVLLNITNRLVGGSSAPQRGYATLQLVEVLFCIGFFLGVPLIAERFGILSVFAALAGLCAGVFLLLAGVPVSAPDGSELTARKDTPVSTQGRVVKLHRSGAPPNTGAAVLSLCATALVFAGYSTVSSSLVSIGAAVGLSVLWVGRVMALGLLASFGGAMFARGLGERAGVLSPILVGLGVLGIDVLVVTLVGGPTAFIGSVLIFFMAMVFLTQYVYALLAELDEAGRWASIGPGFVLTGVALGPDIAGVVSRGVDFTTPGYAALTCIVAAMILFLGAQRLRSRAELASVAQA